jgi:sulfur-oxidizing protein SoxY
MLGHHCRLLCIAGLLAAMQFGVRLAPAATPEPYDPWPGLVQDIFNNRAMNDGDGVIAVEMPYRAEDAAIVPVTLRAKLPPGDTRRQWRRGSNWDRIPRYRKSRRACG